jgi:hypothetical protein
LKRGRVKVVLAVYKKLSELDQYILILCSNVVLNHPTNQQQSIDIKAAIIFNGCGFFNN